MQSFSRNQVLHLWLVLLAGGFIASARCDTISVINTNASGTGSFQQAILTANGTGGTNTIAFNIPGTPPFTITPTNILPQIVVPVIIDATTQPGYTNKPVIQLSGSALANNNSGLRFGMGSDGSILRGLAINRFPGHGIDINNVSNVVVQGNFIGTDVTGTVARGNGNSTNGASGISINTCSGVQIGGTNGGDGNLISGNFNGIFIQSANSNIVQGNFIGINAAGTARLGNTNNGILINPGNGNLIGGASAAARNLISGNGQSGIYLAGSANINGGTTGNIIQGNWIGTGVSGSVVVSNLSDGITLNGAAGNLVCSNVISGNNQAGVSIAGAGATDNAVFGNFIGTDATGNSILGNRLAGVLISGGGGNLIGSTNAGSGNVISGNTLDGVTLSGGTTTNIVQGNIVGLSATGTSTVRNNQNGISLSGASSNLIGGWVDGARNVISGNSQYGVMLATNSGNCVQGNYIGTDISGTLDLGNGNHGVWLASRTSSNSIGGTLPGAGNVISGNGQSGIYLGGTGTAGPITGNIIQGNFVGVDATGTRQLGNYIGGIGLLGASGNLIGGTSPGARNIISANGNSVNGSAGVLFYIGATANQLLGNYIGTDVSGTLALGNTNCGVYLAPLSASNYIGGSVTGAGNVISANGDHIYYQSAVYLTNSSWNVIQGNFIGTKADGVSALGNVGHGIELQAMATNNIIGGTAPGAGNCIAFAQDSQRSGVRVRPYSVNNLISGNSIFGNPELGIDLQAFGVTANTDCETGMTSTNANYGQNYPALTSIYSGTVTRVRGTFDAKAGRTYSLEFFASPSGSSSGYGQGQVYLGQTNLTLNLLSCSSNFTAYLSAPVPAGWVVTATATDAKNNTSEFSAWVRALSVPPVNLSQAGVNLLSLSWTNNGGSFSLQQTSDLTPPVVWQTVTNTPVLQNNFMVTSLGVTNRNMFYRLIAP